MGLVRVEVGEDGLQAAEDGVVGQRLLGLGDGRHARELRRLRTPRLSVLAEPELAEAL